MILDFIMMLMGYLAPLAGIASGFLGVSSGVVNVFLTLMTAISQWIGFVTMFI